MKQASEGRTLESQPPVLGPPWGFFSPDQLLPEWDHTTELHYLADVSLEMLLLLQFPVRHIRHAIPLTIECHVYN